MYKIFTGKSYKYKIGFIGAAMALGALGLYSISTPDDEQPKDAKPEEIGEENQLQLDDNQEQDIEEQIGDFIIKRSDNIVSYQLAVIVDDYLDKTTHILRGADLLESTPRQIYLQKILSLPQINYIHLPTLNVAGRKLSKSNGDDLMYKNDPKKIWLTVLKFLDQKIPPKNLTLNEIIEFAIKNWCVKNIKSKRFIDIDDYIHTS